MTRMMIISGELAMALPVLDMYFTHLTQSTHLVILMIGMALRVRRLGRLRLAVKRVSISCNTFVEEIRTAAEFLSARFGAECGPETMEWAPKQVLRCGQLLRRAVMYRSP